MPSRGVQHRSLHGLVFATIIDHPIGTVRYSRSHTRCAGRDICINRHCASAHPPCKGGGAITPTLLCNGWPRNVGTLCTSALLTCSSPQPSVQQTSKLTVGWCRYLCMPSLAEGLCADLFLITVGFPLAFPCTFSSPATTVSGDVHEASLSH